MPLSGDPMRKLNTILGEIRSFRQIVDLSIGSSDVPLS